MKKNRKPSNRSRKELLKDYARYSSLGFQMIAIIFIGTFGGIKLDEYIRNEFHVFTIVLTLAGLAAAMYYLFRQVMK